VAIGEVYIGTTLTTYLKIFSIDRDIAEKAAQTIGSTVTTVKQEGRKEIYEIRRQGSDSVINIFKQIEPYLKTKKT